MLKEIVFKNAYSCDRKRRIFCTSIINKKDNFIAKTERKYVYIIKKLNRLDSAIVMPSQIYIRNKQDSFLPWRKYTYLIKGSFLAGSRGVTFLIKFAHSLHIEISPA
ncbi:MAG: hypothetical protein AB1629_00155 [Candidatus Omnitrophota bacterium]